VLSENKENPVIILNWKDEVNSDTSVQRSTEQPKHRHLEAIDTISNRTSTRQKNHLLQEKMIFYGQQYKG
jgi:hypothetical protein